MSEHTEQAFIISWARALEERHPELWMLHAIPNGGRFPYRKIGGRRFSPEAMKMIAEGLRPGVPDLCLPVPRRGFHALYIELKVGYNKPSPEQTKFIGALNDYGNLAVVCYGAGEAIRQIVEYLELPKDVIPWGI